MIGVQWTGKGQFTVKSYYDFLNFGGITFAADKIWATPIPLKAKILKLNTSEHFAHEGIGESGPCILCDMATNSCQHIF